MSTSEVKSTPAQTGQIANAQVPPKKGLHTYIRGMLLDCPSRQAFYEKVLAVSMEQFGASVGRIDFAIGGKDESHLQHNPRMELRLAERFSKEYLEPLAGSVTNATGSEPQMKRYQRGEQTMTLLTASVMNIAEDKCDAVITLMFGGEHPAEILLPRIDGITAVASAVLVSKTLNARNDARQQKMNPQPAAVAAGAAGAAVATGQPGPQPAAHGSATADLHATTALSKAAQFKSTKEFGYSIVNSLATQLQAEQVSFGIERNQRIVVEAISNVADFKANSPGVQIVRQAMEECLDHENFVLVQNEKIEGEYESLPIHQQWAAESNNASVFSLPLKQGNGITGVVSIRRAMDKPFRKEEIAGLLQMLTPYGVALPVVEKANRGVGAQLKTAVGTTARETVSKGSIGRKVLLGGLLLGALWFLFGSMTYRPICRTRVTAANMRHFSAPMAGQLKLVNVEPGQQVREGELLVQFDTADLQLRLNSLTKEISTAQVELREAMARDELAAAALARSQINVLQSQVSALQKQIQDSSIIAPFDGTVVLADLQQRVGQNFPQGEEILQIAAEGDWMLEIEIPDDIANYISPEQEGVFSAAASPSDKLAFRVQYVDGAAISMDDRNVFMAHAPMESRPEWMMTGMEGTARIETVSRPVWWVAMHRAVDWARMNFWF